MRGQSFLSLNHVTEVLMTRTMPGVLDGQHLAQTLTVGLHLMFLK